MSAHALPSIRTKLVRLVILPLCAALVLVTGIHLWREADRYLVSKRETLLATAQIFAASTSAATSRGDADTARQALRGIARVPGLIRAEIETMSGGRLAGIGTAVRLGTDVQIGEGPFSALDLLNSRTMTVSVPVVDAGTPVGRLTLIADTRDFRAEFETTLLWSLAISGVLVVLGLALAHRLQRSITAPLLTLTAAMAKVAAERSFHPVPVVASDAQTETLASTFNAMMAETRSAFAAVLDRENEIIERLSRAGEMRDDQTGQHVMRVATVSGFVAESLGLDRAWIDDLRRASPMHDVGKISISDAILHKPGRLDPAERAEMEKHAERGHVILGGSRSALIQMAAEIALSHHERWDGAGYPRGLAGDAIPLSGRITAVADVCDALLSERPYKTPWPLEKVRAHLVEHAGSHFDPACVDAILRRWSDVEAMYAPAAPQLAAA